MKRLIPWAIFALLALLLLLQVYLYGSNLPYVDEWKDTVPAIAHEHPITLTWLWSSFNGHRILLPRLFELGALSLGHGNFRAGAFLNALVLISATFILLYGLSKFRRSIRGDSGAPSTAGQAQVTDAFIPILLLNWGTFADVLWAFEIQFILSVFLILVMLYVALGSPVRISKNGLALLGISLCALPLCGLNGMMFVPIIVLWIAATTFLGRLGTGSSPSNSTLAQPRESQPAVWFCVIVPVAVCLVYFIGWTHQKQPFPTPGQLVSTAIAFMRLGWGIISGSSSDKVFSVSWMPRVCALLALIISLGWFYLASLGRKSETGSTFDANKPARARVNLPAYAGLLALVLLLILGVAPRIAVVLSSALLDCFTPFLIVVGGLSLYSMWRSRPEEYCRTLGLAAFYLSCLLLVASIAVGRGDSALTLSSPHYTILSAMVPCVIYVILRLHDSRFSRFVCVLLLVWVSVWLPVNMNRARVGLSERNRQLGKFNGDLSAGLPLPLLLGEYEGLLGPAESPALYEKSMQQMRLSRIYKFENLNDTMSIESLLHDPEIIVLAHRDPSRPGAAGSDDVNKTQANQYLPSRVGERVTWHFGRQLKGAYFYIKTGVDEAPGDSSALAHYEIAWHSAANGDETPVNHSWLRWPEWLEMDVFNIFYTPDDVDGISVVCILDGTPSSLQEASIVPDLRVRSEKKQD